MSIEDDKEKKKREIYDLCVEYNKYEKFIKEYSEPNKIFEGIGYLIEQELIKKFEDSIYYSNIRFILCNGFDNSERFLETKYNNFQMTYVSQTKFDKKEKLRDRIKFNEFKLITSELWVKISRHNNINEQGIKYRISNNRISLIFNENETIDFIIDNFIINETTLIKDEETLNNFNIIKSLQNSNNFENTDSIKNININQNQNNSNDNFQTEGETAKGETELDPQTISKLLDEEERNNFLSKYKKEIEILILIYSFQKKLKEEINNNKIEKRKGFIISQIWLEKFESIFYYEEINEYLNNNENQEIDKEIDKEIENVYNIIKDKINIVNIEKELQNLISLEIKPKEINIGNEENITYPEIFYIIDENIFNIFKQIDIFANIFNSLEVKNYFINNGKIILKYDSIQIKENNSINNKIIISNLKENYLCIPELLLNYFKQINIKDTFFEHIFRIKNTKYNLDINDKVIIENGKKIGDIYKLIDNVIPNRYKITEIKNDNQKIEDNNNNDIKSQIKGNGQDNPNENKNIITPKEPESNKDLPPINNNKNEVQEIIQNNKNNNNAKEILKTSVIKYKNIDNKKFDVQNELDEFTKKDILALINYHKFKQNFSQKFELSKNGEISEIKIYLIRDEWIDNIKKFYNYELIIKNLDEKEQISTQDIIPFLKKANLFDIIINNQNNKKNDLNLLKSQDYKPIMIEKFNEFKNIIYPNNFDILSVDVFEEISQNKEIIEEFKCDCIINDGKILIKYMKEENNIYLFLIGNYDVVNKKFCYELILNYKNFNGIKYHFQRFNHEKYGEIINKFSPKEQNYLYADYSYPSKIIFGSKLSLNNFDNINQENVNSNISKKEENNSNVPKILLINQELIKKIKFLIYLYFLQEKLNYKINESLLEPSFNERYYLIKNESIDIYKKNFYYDELIKSLQSKEIQSLIRKEKNVNLFLSQEKVEELSEKIINKLNTSYINLINSNSDNIKQNLEKIDFTLEKKLFNNNPELFYYNDCQLIDEKMMDLIKNENQKFDLPIANCTFGEKSVFLKFDKLLNIGKLDERYSLNCEVIIKLKDDKNLETIFNQIKKFNLNLYIENIRFTQMNFKEKQLFDYEVFIIKKENDFIYQYPESNITKEILRQHGFGNEPQVLRARKKEPKDTKNDSLQNLILFYFDYQDLKKKSQNSLKDNYYNNNFGYYYLLSSHWLMKYIEVYKLTSIFYYLMQNDIIGSISNFDKLSLEQKKLMIINKLYDWDNNIIDIDDDSVDNDALKNNDLFNVKFNYFHANSDINFKYYSEFFLVKKETYESLTKFLKLNYHILNYCYFGENSIFMYLNNDNKYTLQEGHLSKNKYYFSTDIFLDYISKTEFEKSLNILIEQGYKNYWSNCLIFKDGSDYYSPIFHLEENIIGHSFIFNRTNSLVDYPNLFINNNLKNLALFYLENEILNKTLMTKDINQFRKYYLINKYWIEEYKKINEYNNALKAFTGNNFVINKVKNLNEKELITEKKLCSIIKNLPPSINSYYNKKNFNFINNISIEPSIEIYQFEENNFFQYFNSFEIISEKVYNIIFGNSQSDFMNLNKQKNNYVNCIFYERIIMIELSKNVNGLEDYVIEAGYLDNNIFKPKYVLIYKEQKNFLEHLNYLNQGQGIINFFKYLNFNQGCCLTFDDANKKEIGKIYNLEIKYQDGKTKIINNVPNNINSNNENSFNNNNNNLSNNQIINNFNVNNNFGQIIPINNNFQNQIKNNFANQIQNNFQNQIPNNQIQNNFPISNQNNFPISNQNNFPFSNQNNFPISNQNNFPISNQNNNQNQIHNNINPPISQISSIITDFPTPPLMGLKNVGATCYMNATLQCFSQIEKLVNYFKYKIYVEQVVIKYQLDNKLCLTQSFKDLIENLWPSNINYIKQEFIHKNSNNSYFAPYEFKQKISDMNPLFQGAQANDSKDLVNFIVMTLHEEMNKANKNKQKSISNNIFNQTDKNVVLSNFMKEFQEENKSVISDLFYAQNINKTFCTNCKETKYNFQTYFFLVFPLEEVRKFTIEFKKQQFMINYNYMKNINPMLFQQMLNNFLINIQYQNSVNIYNCFEYNQKMEYFTGENAMFCNRCQAQYPASYLTRLYTGPEILILVLNRGVGIQYKVKLEFSQTLDLTHYIEGSRKGCKYNLIGVVTHMGESGASGHFIAYCKSPINGNWYRYNDDLVSQVFNFKQEIIDYAMPYILFFQKLKE